MSSAQNVISPNRSVNNTITTLPNNQQIEVVKSIPREPMTVPAILLLEKSTIELNLSKTTDLFDRKQSFISISEDILKIYCNKLASPKSPSMTKRLPSLMLQNLNEGNNEGRVIVIWD